uniref:CSON010469 protein n=1 Tax=Culicoides sonorensis TaxID=179676 RepID=A0A336N212_CULSO
MKSRKLMMAASVYATPPPDLSGEDTALSDASNSSQTNSSSNHSQSKKRTLSATSTPGPITPGSTNLQLSDNSTPDLSKKRRKQSTPIRISANNGNNANNNVTDLNNITNGEVVSEENLLCDDNKESDENDVNMIEKSNSIELKEDTKPVETVPDTDRNEISVIPLNKMNHGANEDKKLDMPTPLMLDAEEAIKLLNNKTNEESKSSPKLDNGDSEDVREKSPDDIKKEQNSMPEWDGEIKRKFPSKPEEWLQLAGLPFPFTPETAAALQASGYFPQLPMLGTMPPVPNFTSSDGTPRPANIPPRIFNPEAYCDLCNKEFCNKYFLKTHKANKHGIYEPPVSNADMASLNQIGQIQQMSQLFQLQQRQQEQAMNQANQAAQAAQAQAAANNEINSQQGSNSPTSTLTPQSILTIENNVYCDVCFKKFNNVFAMRKHRSKVHETPVNGDCNNGQKQVSDTKEQEENASSTPMMKLPDGFREDYSVEQEDVSFTPQPRKLSPISIQQAREANFAFDKLKRLGVINPEAFCELCGKEYCNKYFLRTHKLKRHGIFPTPDDSNSHQKDDQPSSLRPSDRPPWHHIQTSPLNLMISGLDPSIPLIRSSNDDSSDNNTNSPKENSLKNDSSNNITDEEKLSQPHTPLNQQDAEAISVDLQKLQSMIMQLNDLNAHRAVQCTICGKELENRYLLHAHMLSEHNGLGDNNNGIKTASQESSPIPMGQEFEMCKHCDKEFSNVFMLKQHIIDVHGIQLDLSPIREGFVTPDRPMMPLNLPSTPGPNDRRQPFQMTPTSSYCEICNKELCNKYFMKTHMQRMHGIEIENGAQIGGVVCNICNKELCSKYFLRVHKHNTHGIIDDGSPLPPAATRMNGENSLDTDGSYSQDANLKPGEVGEMSNRYFSHFTEVCPLCSRRFRSAKWLKAHLMSDHGKAGTDKLKELESKMNLNSPPSPSIKIPNGMYGIPSPDQNLLSKTALSGLFANSENMASSSQPQRFYQCSHCSFSTPVLPFLYIHERSTHALNLPQQLQSLQSELAVSVAKDQQQQQQQQRASQPTSSSNATPNSTPASTPVPIPAQEPSNNQMPSVLGKPPMNIEPMNILTEMANLTQRPAVYALPQEAGPFVMQSFLVEESNQNDLKLNSNSNNLQQQQQNQNKKFVPVVVFLPVKERILSPINVSFTLTPA